MTQNLLRAALLMGQARWELAEAEIQKALADDSQNAEAHRLLALCLVERDQYDSAEAEARSSVHLAPDDATTHLALATVLFRRRRRAEARVAVEEAIRLDAHNVTAFGLLAWIWFTANHWKEALHAADQGLAIDPDDNDCTNVRAMALVKLGKRKEAGRTIDAALARAPEDSLTHANQGWTLLEAGRREKAMEHFREALRLDPNQEWARAGIVEGLKSKNFIYRWLLKYFLFMSRLGGRQQWFIVIGLYVVIRVISNLSRKHPAAEPFLQPIVALYGVFAVLTWLGSPLFNLLLFLDKSGRYALSPDQRKGAMAVGGVLATAILLAATAVILDEPRLIVAAVNAALVAIPTSAIFTGCSAGWPRQTMMALTVLIGGLGAWPLLQYLTHPAAATGSTDGQVENLFILCLVASQFAANALARAEPTR